MAYGGPKRMSRVDHNTPVRVFRRPDGWRFEIGRFLADGPYQARQEAFVTAKQAFARLQFAQ